MYRNRKLQLVAVFALGMFIITAFQNCAPVSFSAEQISLNSSSSSVEAVKSQGPALCQAVGHLEFNLSFDQSKSYSCYDQTAQAAPTGPVCTSGPVVTKFADSASLAQDCLALTVCGTKAREILEVEGTNTIKKYRFVYDNLPMGCSGSIKIKTLSDQANKESEAEDSAILKVSIPVASCNTCADGVTKTCGACPVNPPGLSDYSWRTGSFGSCSAAPSYNYGSWGACVSGQQTRSAVCLNTAGSQSRTVSCVNSSGVVVSDSFCSAAKPASSQSCTSACSGAAVTTQTCVTQDDYSWRTGSFGSCSAAPSYNYGSWGACVSGQQTRSAVCLNTAGSQSRTVSCVNSSGAVVSDSFCSAAKPASSQSCTSACSGAAVTTQTCVTQDDYSWRTGSFGSCSAAPSYNYGSWGACVSGQQTRSAVCLNTAGSQSRTVSCVNSSGAVVSDSFCSAAKPASSQSCTSACSGAAVTTQTCVTQQCDRTELVTLYNQSVTKQTAKIENFAQNCVDTVTTYEQMMAGEGQTRFVNTCAVRWCSKIFGTIDAIGLVTNQIINTGSGYAAGQTLQVECRTNLKNVSTSNEACKQIIQNKQPLVWFAVSYSEATACGGSPQEAIGIYYSDSARSACATKYCLNKYDGYTRGFLTEVSPAAKSIVCSRVD